MTTAVEPEWDDDTRAWVEGLADHDRAVCLGCGLHEDVIHHMGAHMQIVDNYCPACRALARYQRKVDDRDRVWEKTYPNADPGKPRPNDGLHLTLRQASPSEIRTQRRLQRQMAQQQATTEQDRPSGKKRLNRR